MAPSGLAGADRMEEVADRQIFQTAEVAADEELSKDMGMVVGLVEVVTETKAILLATT